MPPSCEPLTPLAASPRGLERIQERVGRRRRRRAAAGVTVALLIVGVFAPRGSPPTPAAAPTASAAAELLAHADHPVLVAWGRTEAPLPPMATAHPDVVRVVQPGTTR